MATINIEAQLTGSSEAAAVPVRKVQMSATLTSTSGSYQLRGRRQSGFSIDDAAFAVDESGDVRGDDR